MELETKGETLRKAVQWISDRRLEKPDASLSQLIDEASLRFDLTPLQAQFLLDELLEQPAR
jgi:hypothetical protein